MPYTISFPSDVSVIPPVGAMPMPADFAHRHIFMLGRPRHDTLSDFAIRHPQVNCSRRAKLFAPFDALEGFDELIKQEEQRILSDEEQEQLDQ